MRELGIIVHPFFPKHKMPEMLSAYKKRIDSIAKRSGHHLLIEYPAKTAIVDNEEMTALVSYARAKLTPQRVLVQHSDENFHTSVSAELLVRKLKSLGFDPHSSRVNFYGEYVDECVTQHAYMLAPRLVLPHRRKNAVKILLEYCGSRNISTYAPNHAALRDKGKEIGMMRWHVRETLRHIREQK